MYVWPDKRSLSCRVLTNQHYKRFPIKVRVLHHGWLDLVVLGFLLKGQQLLLVGLLQALRHIVIDCGDDVFPLDKIGHSETVGLPSITAWHSVNTMLNKWTGIVQHWSWTTVLVSTAGWEVRSARCCCVCLNLSSNEFWPGLTLTLDCILIMWGWMNTYTESKYILLWKPCQLTLFCFYNICRYFWFN